MKKISIVLFIFLFTINAFSNDFKTFLTTNIGNYVEVHFKKKEQDQATPNSAILVKVLTDSIVLSYGTQTFLIKLEAIQYVRIYQK